MNPYENFPFDPEKHRFNEHRLSPAQTTILGELLRQKGRPVSIYRFCNMTGSNSPESIKVAVCNMRPKIAPMLKIAAVRGEQSYFVDVGKMAPSKDSQMSDAQIGPRRTEERDAFLRRVYPTSMPMEDVTAGFNALPGRQMWAWNIHNLAWEMGLRRPE